MGLVNVNKSFKAQSGVVLVVSLVFLVALTAVAGALMQNSSTDMKMAGASQDKQIATQQAISAIDEIIASHVTGPSDQNVFAQPVVTYTATGDAGVNVLGSIVSTSANVTNANVNVVNNEYGLETTCPHSRNASSVQVFGCNVLRIQLNKTYGRKGNSNIQVVSGVAQQVLK
jgi:Tfp pilus assembly protein PilX